jgi:hypothetical protein
MGTINLQNRSLSIIFIFIILAASIVLAEFVTFGFAQGQRGNSTTSSALTPQQKAAICNPGNPKLNFVNGTESKICNIPPTPTSTPTNTTTTMPTPTPPANNTTTPTTGGKQLPPSLYKQGYAKGVADAKSIQITVPPNGTMSPDAVDCDSDIDPHMSNHDYCLGYQLGYADTYNNRVAGSK